MGTNTTQETLNRVEFLHAHPSFGFGTYWMGFFVDGVLLGVLLTLFYYWARYGGAERRVVRWTVWFLVILSMAISLFIIAFMWHLFIFNFGDYTVFSDANSAGWFSWFFTLETFARTPVSMFFADRAWRMTGKSKIYALLTIALALASTSSAIAAKVLAPNQNRIDLVTYLVFGWIACESINDLLTTCVIAYYLWKSRCRGSWQPTNRIIAKLLLLVVETQLPPTIMAVVFLILYIAVPQTTLIAFFICTPKVYVCCLLIVLNAKTRLRAEMASLNRVSDEEARRRDVERGAGGASPPSVPEGIEMVKFDPVAAVLHSGVASPAPSRKSSAEQLDPAKSHDTPPTSMPESVCPPGQSTFSAVHEDVSVLCHA